MYRKIKLSDDVNRYIIEYLVSKRGMHLCEVCMIEEECCFIGEIVGGKHYFGTVSILADSDGMIDEHNFEIHKTSTYIDDDAEQKQKEVELKTLQEYKDGFYELYKDLEEKQRTGIIS